MVCSMYFAELKTGVTRDRRGLEGSDWDISVFDIFSVDCRGSQAQTIDNAGES